MELKLFLVHRLNCSIGSNRKLDLFSNKINATVSRCTWMIFKSLISIRWALSEIVLSDTLCSWRTSRRRFLFRFLVWSKLSKDELRSTNSSHVRGLRQVLKIFILYLFPDVPIHFVCQYRILLLCALHFPRSK